MPNHSSRGLESVVQEFVSEITQTVSKVFGTSIDIDALVASQANDGPDLAGFAFSLGVEVNGSFAYRLEAVYNCSWNSNEQFMAVHRSSFAVFLTESNEPLFHYDYERHVRGLIPGAHINFHPHRADLVKAFDRAGRKYRGKNYRKRIDGGGVVSGSELHFPVGGSRFRPALEDVIEFLVVELGADATDSWKGAVHDGRLKWRRQQLRAAVSDDPKTAVEELTRLGYEISGGTSHERNRPRLTEW